MNCLVTSSIKRLTSASINHMAMGSSRTINGQIIFTEIFKINMNRLDHFEYQTFDKCKYQSYDKCKYQSYGQFKSYNKWSNYFYRNIQNQYELFGHFEYQTFDERKYQSYDKCKYQSYGQFKSYNKWSNYFYRNIQNQYELFGHFEYQTFDKRKYQSYDKMQVSIIRSVQVVRQMVKTSINYVTNENINHIVRSSQPGK